MERLFFTYFSTPDFDSIFIYIIMDIANVRSGRPVDRVRSIGGGVTHRFTIIGKKYFRFQVLLS